jgi:hypothetical protein
MHAWVLGTNQAHSAQMGTVTRSPGDGPDASPRHGRRAVMTVSSR